MIVSCVNLLPALELNHRHLVLQRINSMRSNRTFAVPNKSGLWQRRFRHTALHGEFKRAACYNICRFVNLCRIFNCSRCTTRKNWCRADLWKMARAESVSSMSSTSDANNNCLQSAAAVDHFRRRLLTLRRCLLAFRRSERLSVPVRWCICEEFSFRCLQRAQTSSRFLKGFSAGTPGSIIARVADFSASSGSLRQHLSNTKRAVGFNKWFARIVKLRRIWCNKQNKRFAQQRLTRRIV